MNEHEKETRPVGQMQHGQGKEPRPCFGRNAMTTQGGGFWSWVALGVLAMLRMEGFASGQEAFDLIIKNARIVDGSGGTAYQGDIAIRGDLIVEAGKLSSEKAKKIIDARGRGAAPGFIDMMGQSSQILVTDRASAESKIRQGITTLLVGEGGSVAPRAAHAKPPTGFDKGWTTFDEYFRLLEEKKIPINVIHNVCEATLRTMIIGDKDQDPTPQQLEKMKGYVEQAMKDGCVGFSTALIYPPAAYAKTEELIELARVAGRYNGVYFAHLRNENGGLLEAIQESIRIGKEADIAIHVYHLKAAGQDHWPLMPKALKLLAEARKEGLEATADIYPYLRNGIGLRSFIHPRHYAQGAAAFLPELSDPEARKQLRREIETTTDWENWYQHVGKNWDNVLVSSLGKSVKEVAEERGADVWDAFFDLVRTGVSVLAKSMNEEQKHQALRDAFVCFDTDAGPVNPARAEGAHPRAFGTFPRVLAKYVREEKVISLEEAIRKMSSLPARILRMDRWGTIEPGRIADVVLFDPDRVQDQATFTDPLRFSEGIDCVIVSGQIVLHEGRITGALPGKVIRCKGDGGNSVRHEYCDLHRPPIAPSEIGG
jgi:N-acyl-D-aspartate/D-glutamate deacylase